MESIIIFFQDYAWYILAFFGLWALKKYRQKESFFELFSEMITGFVSVTFGKKYTQKAGMSEGFVFILVAATAVFIFLNTYPVILADISERLQSWHITEHKEWIHPTAQGLSVIVIGGLLLIERLSLEMLIAKHSGGRDFYLFWTKTKFFTTQKVGYFILFISSAGLVMVLVSTANGKRESAATVDLKALPITDFSADPQSQILKEQISEHLESKKDYTELASESHAKATEWEKKAPKMADKQHAWKIVTESKNLAAKYRNRAAKEASAAQVAQNKLIVRSTFLEKEKKEITAAGMAAAATAYSLGAWAGLGLDIFYLFASWLHILIKGKKFKAVVYEQLEEQPQIKKLATGKQPAGRQLATGTGNLLNKAKESLSNYLNPSRLSTEPTATAQQPVNPVQQPVKNEQPKNETNEQPENETNGLSHAGFSAVQKRKITVAKFTAAADGQYDPHLSDIIDFIEEPGQQTLRGFSGLIATVTGCNPETVRSFISRVKIFHENQQ